MIDFDEAQRRLAAAAAPLGTETVALGEAHRRVAAEDVVSRHAAPRADTSAMDGYAVREADLAGGPATLRVIGESWPGKGFDGALAPGDCVRLFTGAPVPAGADRVVMQEIVERDGDGARIAGPVAAPRFIRRAGSDFTAGEVLVGRGALLTPGALVAAAAADVGAMVVHRRPRVRLIATGDELAAPGDGRAAPGSIPDSVSVAVAALASEWGGEITGAARLGDDLPKLEHAAREALDHADVVVVAGGASVGDRDFARAMFAGVELEPVFARVAIKPGMPVWLARCRQRLVLGLPGNPTSALVTARLFLAPLLCALGGRAPGAALAWRTLTLAHAIDTGGPRETFARGIERDGLAHLFDDQESHAQKLLAAARLLVRRPAGDPARPAGATVGVLDL